MPLAGRDGMKAVEEVMEESDGFGVIVDVAVRMSAQTVGHQNGTPDVGSKGVGDYVVGRQNVPVLAIAKSAVVVGTRLMVHPGYAPKPRRQMPMKVICIEGDVVGEDGGGGECIHWHIRARQGYGQTQGHHYQQPPTSTPGHNMVVVGSPDNKRNQPFVDWDAGCDHGRRHVQEHERDD